MLVARFILTILLLGMIQFSTAQPFLRIDFNDRSGTNDSPACTHPDFDSFVINPGGGAAIQTNPVSFSFGTITVSVKDALSTGYDDRKRTLPTNSASFTQAQLLQDFIFAQGTAANSGLDIRVSGLVATQSHQITIWSFDSESTNNRVSDWFANGVLVRNNYTFNGAILPTSDNDYRFTFNAVVDSNGEILIQARRDSTSSPSGSGVFLNALQIGPIPNQNPPCNTTTHFKPGVNLDSWTGGYTTNEQNQSIALMQEAGVKWVRVNTPWHALEPDQKGSYDPWYLPLYDHLMQKLHENGMKVIFVNATTPYWASADPNKTPGPPNNWDLQYKPTNFNDHTDFQLFLLNRYRSTGPHAFEIWNEPDISNFWPSGPSATNYLDMLRSAYIAIKNADPQAMVLNGGLTDRNSSSNYLTALYAAGAKQYFDVMSQHTYPRAPQYETIVGTVRNIMVANGDSAKKIWLTECGWPTYPNDNNAVDFARQAQYLTNLFTRLATYPYVELGLWYNLRSYDETQKEGSFGLLLPSFTKKPSFDAFKNWTIAASIPCPLLQITDTSRLPNGHMRLYFTGTAGQNYSIQGATTLLDWITIASNISSTNSLHFYEDSAAADMPRRFYRIMKP